MFGWFKKQPESAPPWPGPDFSSVDSRAKAEELFRRGDLEKFLLRPEIFGGEDHPLNVLYVPVGLATVRSQLDENIIAPLVEQGLITGYKASPEYHGDSFIPMAITIKASGEREVNSTINIWGPALLREKS